MSNPEKKFIFEPKPDALPVTPEAEAFERGFWSGYQQGQLAERNRSDRSGDPFGRLNRLSDIIRTEDTKTLPETLVQSYDNNLASLQVPKPRSEDDFDDPFFKPTKPSLMDDLERARL